MYKNVGRLERPGIITYGEAARLMGYSVQAGRTLGSALGLISGLCNEKGLPHLNSIVVDFETHEPGEGVPLSRGVSIEEMQRQVLGINWFGLKAPSVRNFRDLQGTYGATETA